MKKAFDSLSAMFSKDPPGFYTFLVSNLALLVLIFLPVLLASFGADPKVGSLFIKNPGFDSRVVLSYFGLSIFFYFMYSIFVKPIQWGFYIGLMRTGNAKEAWAKAAGNYGRMIGLTTLRLVAYFASSSTIGFIFYIILIIPLAFLTIGGATGSTTYLIILGLMMLVVFCAIVYFIDVTVVLCLFDAVNTKETVVNIIEKTIKHGQVARFPVFLIYTATKLILWAIVIVAGIFLYEYFYIPVFVAILALLLFPVIVVGLSQPFFLDYRKVVDGLTAPLEPQQPTTQVDVTPPTL